MWNSGPRSPRGVLRQMLKSSQRLADTGGFVYRTQAPAADLDLDVPAILEQGLFVDIGKEAGLGVAVGVADVIAAHSGLVADIASHGVVLFPVCRPVLVVNRWLARCSEYNMDRIYEPPCHRYLLVR